MLAANATSESHIRLKHAQDIARACPVSLFDEIALTGSSARGIATDSSDIEINFWVHSLPDLQTRVEWIHSLGVVDVIAHSQARPDNSFWINGIYQGIELEAGWQSFTDLDSALEQIMNAKTTDHKALRLAELLVSAKTLRGSGALDKWQSRLENYPSELSHKLIDTALTDWLSEDWHTNHLHLSNFTEDIHRVWRLIFALNQQWEINWKYAHHSLNSLNIYPKNITQRIWEIQQNDTRTALKPMLKLISDTLELIKTNLGDYQGLTENLNFIKEHS